MTTIAYGGGLEGGRKVVQEADGVAGERFEFAPRASFEIARRNLFGKNRSATLFASGSLPLNPAGTRRTTSTTVPEYRVARHVPRAAGLRHAGGRVSRRHVRTADSIELRLPAARRQRGPRPACHSPTVVRQRQLPDSADRGVQQQRQPRRPAADRPRLSARCGCRRFWRRSRTTRGTIRPMPRRATCSASTASSPRGPSARKWGS